MHIQPVICCQCGSPLRIEVAPLGAELVVCNYCSALLEVKPSHDRQVTQLHQELHAAQQLNAKQIQAEEASRIKGRISLLDRQWNLWWPAGLMTASQARTTCQVLGGLTLVTIVTSIGYDWFQPGFSWTGMGPAIATVSGGLGLVAFSTMTLYASDRQNYEEERTQLWAELVDVYRQE